MWELPKHLGERTIGGGGGGNGGKQTNHELLFGLVNINYYLNYVVKYSDVEDKTTQSFLAENKNCK